METRLKTKLLNAPKYVFGIYDKKKVLITANAKTNLLNPSALWTDNESLVLLIYDYFEMLWFTLSIKEVF